MNQSTQQIIFVRDTQPLVNCDVRLAGSNDPAWKTDDEGRLDMKLEPGTHKVEVLSDEGWVAQDIHINDARNSLLVVQLNVRDTVASVPGGPKNTQAFAAQFQALEDRYDVESVLGRGGMGVVVKAYDKTLERHVAMKMLSESLRENEEAQRIFLIEARQVAKLRHPNLVGVHDVTSIDGVALMIFEFVDGKEVEQIYNEQGPLSETQVRNIAHQLGEALEYLHDQGVIHRDIKPSNMMLKSDGTLKIIDFGLARSLEQINIRGTQVRGTPAYMAPEQIEGKHLGYATDLYQAGVSLFELLTGRLPFDEEGITYAHLFEDAPPIEDFLPGISADIALVINMCLRKDPLARPASAAALAGLGTSTSAYLTREDLPAVALYDQTASIPISSLTGGNPAVAPSGGSTTRFGVAIALLATLILLSVAVIFVLLQSPEPKATPKEVVVASAPDEEPKATSTAVTIDETADDAASASASETTSEAVKTAKRASNAQVVAEPDEPVAKKTPSTTPSSTRPVKRAPVATPDRGAKKPIKQVESKALGAKQAEDSSSKDSKDVDTGKPLPPGVDPPKAPIAPVPARPEPRPLPNPLVVTRPVEAVPIISKSGIATTTTETKKKPTKIKKDPVVRSKVVPKIKKEKAPPRSF